MDIKYDILREKTFANFCK